MPIRFETSQVRGIKYVSNMVNDEKENSDEEFEDTFMTKEEAEQYLSASISNRGIPFVRHIDYSKDCSYYNSLDEYLDNLHERNLPSVVIFNGNGQADVIVFDNSTRYFDVSFSNGEYASVSVKGKIIENAPSNISLENKKKLLEAFPLVYERVRFNYTPIDYCKITGKEMPFQCDARKNCDEEEEILIDF